MQNFLNKQELVVPVADVATNVFAMDVIGNKNDTVAGTSVIALNKQAYARLGAPAGASMSADIAVIDGYFDVPGADVATNVTVRDVVGNKTDTAVGTSLYAKAVGILANLLTVMSNTGVLVSKSAAALPQTNQSALFTVTGSVQILAISGFVTVDIGAVPNATKLVANPTVGADVDLCATNDITGDTVGTMYSITGTFANPMIATASGAHESQANPITVAAGTIDINCAGSDGGGGRTQWVILYRAMSPGSSVVSA
jgi:hypothetical protein